MTELATRNASYIRRETAVASIINGVISLGFFLVAFGLNALVPVWGIGNYAFDYLPQSFAVAFFSSFVPTLLASKAIVAGKIAASKTPPTILANLGASVLRGVIAAVVAGGAVALVLRVAGVEVLATYPALAAKVAYGAVLGALVARVSLKKLLG